MPTPTFWVERTGKSRRWLRVTGGWTGDDDPQRHYHDAMVLLDDVPTLFNPDGHIASLDADIADDDPRWPTTCARCGEPFGEDSDRDVFQMELYSRPDSHDAWINRALGSNPVGADPIPPGGMFDAWWSPQKGPDGLSLTVVLPNGHAWHVDHRASNCGSPDDDVHRCWVRHGDPRTEPVTVDKNGHTCTAGGGSIQTDGYHGFLQNGQLTDG